MIYIQKPISFYVNSRLVGQKFLIIPEYFLSFSLYEAKSELSMLTTCKIIPRNESNQLLKKNHYEKTGSYSLRFDLTVTRKLPVNSNGRMERLMCNFHYLGYYCSPNLSIHQNSTQELTWNFLVTLKELIT